MKKILFCFLSLGLITSMTAQENLKYQKPSSEILELVDVEMAPSTIIDSNGENVLFLYRDTYKTISELSEKELRLGGLRINPATNIGSRVSYYNNIKMKSLGEKEPVQITGLPENPKLAYFNWSPDETKMAFTNTTDQGVELWMVDLKEKAAKKLSEANLNANMGSPIDWFEDGNALLVKMLPEDREELINSQNAVPEGPTVSTSEGEKAQNRTYQDLLQNPIDEHNFEVLAKSNLMKVDLNGNVNPWKDKSMYTGISFSPDGNYVMVTHLKHPFSYLVPYHRFPSETNVYDKEGNLVNKVLEVPLTEVLPQGFMAEREGRRGLRWRSDHPSTLIYTVALDKGDPEVEVPFRDEVFMLKAPFEGEGTSILKTKDRFSGIYWGDENTAIATDYWWNTRNTRSYLFDPSNPNEEPKILFDRNYQDRYSDPGNFVTEKNKYGSYVLSLDGSNAYLMGAGYSEEGQFPFVDEIDLENGETERLYQSAYTDKKENLVDAIDIERGDILVRIESAVEYPNYYIRNIKGNNDLEQITHFENPFKAIQDVHKEVITYKREDGLDLSGTLYLPVGYDMDKKEKLPMILWAYPTEYKDKASAGQVTSNPNDFTYPYYGSPIYWLTKGYAILDDASFPIVGEGDEEPNDSFRSQLVANAKAAIDAVDELGYIDRDRVAVGGHSYGAFMVGNLLSHSDLFAAGIARSGAYNRTLTPFGFQSEERSYWEAPEVYYNMSPFMHADKLNAPILLIHGEADNNSGTYPMQSERYFNALKGLGKTARLVMLPKESHGYSAKESVLHVLWEQDKWLEKYVKNKNTEKNTVEKKEETIKQ